MNFPIIDALQKQFDHIELRPSLDCPAISVPQDKLIETVSRLRDHHSYTMLVDATAVDWNDQSPRFTVVYHLLNIVNGQYLRVASNCTDDIHPTSPSLTPLYPAADWHERECFDMFGIEFAGHNDLRRILMWDEYPYFPLRKEFPLAGHETDLPAPDVVQRTQAKVSAAPMMGGPFTAPQASSMKHREPSAKDQSWTESNEKPLDF